MSYFAFFFLLFDLVTASAKEPPASVGFRALNVPGIEAVLWYPTDSSSPLEAVADNPVFVGVPVVKDAPIRAGVHPVAILSHGYSGLWRNQAWLAGRLAKAGFIVASLNHPGTTFGDMDRTWATRPDERPRQISGVLDALLADDGISAHMDRSRIAVVGHSLGGWTALSLAGAIFDPARMTDACAGGSEKMVCTVFLDGGLTVSTPVMSARDERISAAILLDMEGIRGFTPESLGRIEIPVLALVAGMEDPALPLGWESRAQSALLPPAASRYAEIIGATHFSFMSLCKPGAEELLEEDAYVCRGETAPRAELHDEIASTIIRFLNAGTRLVSALQSP